MMKVVLIMCLVAYASAFEDDNSHSFITWHEKASVSPSHANKPKKPWIETISWSPRAFIYHGFLSDKECKHLIQLAESRLERSRVVAKAGEPDTHEVRTSFSAGLGIGQDPVVARIEDRIAKWTRLPVENGEPIEVLRYKTGQKYDAHHDFFEDDEAGRQELAGKGGNRVATVLMYLASLDPGSGGETALPLAEPIDAGLQSPGQLASECASRMGIYVQPQQGDALLFWDLKVDGVTPDRATFHASCPTYNGSKWTATKWIHGRSLI
jgi:prolyl 4-hydroxylase